MIEPLEIDRVIDLIGLSDPKAMTKPPSARAATDDIY